MWSLAHNIGGQSQCEGRVGESKPRVESVSFCCGRRGGAIHLEMQVSLGRQESLLDPQEALALPIGPTLDL